MSLSCASRYLGPSEVQDTHSLLSVNTHDGQLAVSPLRQLLGPAHYPSTDMITLNFC